MANNISIKNPMGVTPKQKGSGFVNLNKILQANVGNQLGQKIASGIGQGTQEVQQGLGQAKSQFQQQADAGNLATQANIQARQQALQNIGSGQTNVSDEQAKQFGSFLSGQYTGPKELDSSKVAQLGSRAQEVQGFGQALRSGGDKTKVLQAFAGKGPYSTGQQRLDSLLLGKGPNAQELAQARQQSAGLQQQVGREQDVARQIGQLRTGEAQQFAKETGEQIGAQKGGIEQAVGMQYGQLEAAQKEAFDRINQKLSQGQPLTQEEANMLGLTEDTETYTLDPTSFLGKAALSKGAAASQLQKSQLDALAKLSQKDAKDFTDVGTKEADYDAQKGLTFDLPQLQKQAAALQQQYESTRQTAPVGNVAAEQLGGVIQDEGGNSQYEYRGAVQSMPNLRGLSIDKARAALDAYEQRLAPFRSRVENGIPSPLPPGHPLAAMFGGGRESKTKEGNLKHVYDQVNDRIARARQALAEQESQMKKQYGVDKKISVQGTKKEAKVQPMDTAK